MDFLVNALIYIFLYLYLWMVVLLDFSHSPTMLKRYIALLSFAIFICFIGFRWETGTDWSPYKELFDTLELDWTFLLNVYHFDLGYVLFNALIRLFTDDYTIFLLANSIITMLFLARLVLKISPYPNLTIFIFYVSFMIGQFMGSNRRMMAMVFLLWAFYFLYERRKMPYLLCLLVAFLFHRTAVVGLAALMLPRHIFSIKKTILLLSVAFILGVSQMPAMLIKTMGYLLSQIMSNPIVEKMVFYSENNDDYILYSTGSMLISTFLAVAKRLVLLLFYFYIMKRYEIDKFTQYIYNVYLLGFIGYLLFIGSFFQMLTPYFALMEIFLVARMSSYVIGKYKIAFWMVLFFYGLFQMWSALNVYPDLYMPYKSCWN